MSKLDWKGMEAILKKVINGQKVYVGSWRNSPLGRVQLFNAQRRISAFAQNKGVSVGFTILPAGKMLQLYIFPH